MPRLVQAVPKYRKHRAKGLAVVALAGKDVYLGKYGSQASRMLYERLMAEYLGGNRNPIPFEQDAGMTVVEVLAVELRDNSGRVHGLRIFFCWR